MLDKQQEAFELLTALRGANVSYKMFAQISGINLNSLYAWMHRKKMPQTKAEYIINAIKYYFPEQYAIISIENNDCETL